MTLEYSQLLYPGQEKGTAILRQATRHNRFLYAIILLLTIALGFNYYSIENNEVIETPTTPCPAPIVELKSQQPDLVYRGVVDSMDGIGYKFKDSGALPLDPRYSELDRMAKCDLSTNPVNPANNVTKIMEAFNNCVKPKLETFGGSALSMDLGWVETMKSCDDVKEFENLKIEPFNNLHETKWVVLPRCKEANTMVTLGVGHDTKAEEFLNRTLPGTSFYGADPIIEPNIQLYSAFGKFFPFAVGRQSGMTSFKVLPNQNQKTRRYVWQDVTTIEVTYFLEEVLKLKRIDIMWVDIEGGEFEFLDYVHKGAKFDQHGITICQFNFEMHPVLRDDGDAKFKQFIDTIMEQGRYIFLKPRRTGRGVFRMFVLNMEDPTCLRKFVL